MLSERSESKQPTAEPPCYVYIIECQGGYLYTGISTDPQRRFQQHQAGGSRFTKARPALRLIWTERHPSRQSAAQRERQLKGWTRAKKLALAAGDLKRLKQL